jgi:hypothetical protein
VAPVQEHGWRKQDLETSFKDTMTRMFAIGLVLKSSGSGPNHGIYDKYYDFSIIMEKISIKMNQIFGGKRRGCGHIYCN